MINTSFRLRIQKILSKISLGKQVTLKEKVYINKCAKKNQNLSSWLRKASRFQREDQITKQIDQYLMDLI